MNFQLVYFGPAEIDIHNPKISLVLVQKPNLSNEITDRLMNVNFRHTIPTVEFQIVNVPSVHIFDFRDEVAIAVKSAFQNDDFLSLANALKKTALIEVVKVDDQFYVFIIKAPKGTLKRNLKRTFEVNIELEGRVSTHKFFFFEGGSHSRNTISYATLYKSG